MWRLRARPDWTTAIDLEPVTTQRSEARPTSAQPETRSTKRPRQEEPGPSSSQPSLTQSLLDRQRQESIVTALQLHVNPQEAGIKLLLPPLLWTTPSPCAPLRTWRHSACTANGHRSRSLASYWTACRQCRTRDTPPPALLSRQIIKVFFRGPLAGSPDGGPPSADKTIPHGQPLAVAPTVIPRCFLLMGLHSDHHNHKSVRNVLIPLSVFAGSQLFVESEEGDVSLDVQSNIRGHVHPITLPFLAFDAHKRHSWSGCRMILGTFHIRDADRLPIRTRNLLRALGYPLHKKSASKKLTTLGPLAAPSQTPLGSGRGGGGSARFVAQRSGLSGHSRRSA